MMKLEGWSPIFGSFALALVGSFLHALLPATDPWPEALPSLYFVPIVIAAIRFEVKAAIGVAIASGSAHAIVTAWGLDESWTQLSLLMVLFVSVGITTAKVTRIHQHLIAGGQAVVSGPGGSSLREAYGELHEATELRGFKQIVVGLVHRFRNPLASIEGAVWLLQDTQIPPDKRDEFVTIIRKESHDLNRSLSDILYFTQPRKPHLKEVNLSRLADEVVQLAGPREHGPFFLFKKEFPADLPPLLCDPEQIRVALVNVAINAIQAMPGGGQITIAARVKGRNLSITIADRGRGVSHDIAERIFEPFFTTREAALGLGLTVVSNIVRAHGGNISLVPNLPHGTSVNIELPLDPLEAHEHGANLSR